MDTDNGQRSGAELSNYAVWRDVPGVIEHRGIAYFPSYSAARRIRDMFDVSRIVEYDRGYAVQISNSGPYIGSDLYDMLARHKAERDALEATL